MLRITIKEPRASHSEASVAEFRKALKRAKPKPRSKPKRKKSQAQ